jgi:hypothetical protein
MDFESSVERAGAARWCALVATISLMLTSASAARGEAPVRTAWWVAARPWTCAGETGPLARQIELACDATGSCRIAADESSASRRAVLECGENGWTLVAEDAKGTPLWTLSLGPGDDDDARLRRAAVWIARSEGSGVVSRIEAAPKLEIATISPSRWRDTASDQEKPDPSSPDPVAPHLFLGVMGHTTLSTLTNTFNDYVPMGGGRALVMGSIPGLLGPVRFGLAATIEHDLMNAPYASYSSNHTFFRPGVIVGLGAPFEEGSIVGGSLEAGPAFFYGMHEWTSDGELKTEVTGVYGQAAFYIQAPIEGSVRPFLSATASALTAFNNDSPSVLFGVDLGLVWESH